MLHNGGGGLRVKITIISEFLGTSKYSKIVVVGLIGTRKETIIAHVPASDYYHAPSPCNGLALHSQCHFLKTSVGDEKGTNINLCTFRLIIRACI